MIVIGLAGQAGVGKDTVADFLVRRYGFIKFAFSDALYREVAAAFGLEDETILRDRATKEEPQAMLQLRRCKDVEFCRLAVNIMDGRNRRAAVPPFLYPEGQALSPREVLQWWGTDYRRAQDSEYWVKASAQWMRGLATMFRFPEQRPQYFVNTTVRFPNEQSFIHEFDGGNVWHIRRDLAAPVSAHVSETPLPVLENERELWNNDTIDRLFHGVELLIANPTAKFVRVEPMLPLGAGRVASASER